MRIISGRLIAPRIEIDLPSLDVLEIDAGGHVEMTIFRLG